jgi:hypothetical protein
MKLKVKGRAEALQHRELKMNTLSLNTLQKKLNLM